MLRVGLIGYGYWGPNLLRNYIELPQAWVEWACDSRPEALAKAKSRYPAVAAIVFLVADGCVRAERERLSFRNGGLFHEQVFQERVQQGDGLGPPLFAPQHAGHAIIGIAAVRVHRRSREG